MLKGRMAAHLRKRDDGARENDRERGGETQLGTIRRAVLEDRGGMEG